MKKARNLFLVLLACLVLYMPAPSEAAYERGKAVEIFNATKLDALKSSAACIADVESGTVLFHKDGDTPYFPGNVVKTMTMLLAYEAMREGRVEINSQFMVSAKAQQVSEGRARVFLDAGKHEKITVEQALEAISIAGAVDAAQALGEYLGGGEAFFIEQMNEMAAKLGMTNSYFADSTGISSDNKLTANDLGKMAAYFMKNYPGVVSFTQKTSGIFKHTSTGEKDTMMYSGNQLLSFYEKSDGLLAGSSSAGCSQIATVEIDGKRVVAVVLGAADENIRAAELKKLLLHGIEDYDYTLLDAEGTFVRKISVTDGKNKKVSVSLNSDFSALIAKNAVEQVEREVVIDKSVAAPVSEGQKVGEIIYKLDGEEIGRVEVVTDEPVAKIGWFARLWRSILKWLHLD